MGCLDMNHVSNRIELSGSDIDTITELQDGTVTHRVNGPRAIGLSDLSKSGVLDYLENSNLIFRSKTRFVEGNSFVILQEYGQLIYPAEWTIEMLRECGQTVLEIWKVLDNHGYGLIDCHPYNFVFEGGKPKLVDVGSIQKKQGSSDVLFPELEFRSSYLIPLKLHSKGLPGTAHLIVSQEDQGLNANEHGLLFSGLLEKFLLFLGSGKRFRIRSRFLAPVAFTKPSTSKLQVKEFLKHFTRFLALKRFQKFEGFLKGVKLDEDQGSIWNDYDSAFQITERFKKIAAILLDLRPSNILDIGGNSGEVARFLLDQVPTIEKYQVLDFDSTSIDRGRIRSKDNRLHFARFNFVFPWVSPNSLSYQMRFKSEVVIALAVTHHLFLTEGMSFERIFERMATLCEKYLLIEFMPLGLWTPGADEVVKNPGYTEANFHMALVSYFDLVEVHRYEKNRILFVAKTL
jgi:hypothetical protein